MNSVASGDCRGGVEGGSDAAASGDCRGGVDGGSDVRRKTKGLSTSLRFGRDDAWVANADISDGIRPSLSL